MQHHVDFKLFRHNLVILAFTVSQHLPSFHTHLCVSTVSLVVWIRHLDSPRLLLILPCLPPLLIRNLDTSIGNSASVVHWSYQFWANPLRFRHDSS